MAENLALWLLPVAAGGFIYIALSDLVPELHKAKAAKHFFLQFVALALGITLMYLLLGLET